MWLLVLTNLWRPSHLYVYKWSNLLVKDWTCCGNVLVFHLALKNFSLISITLSTRAQLIKELRSGNKRKEVHCLRQEVEMNAAKQGSRLLKRISLVDESRRGGDPSCVLAVRSLYLSIDPHPSLIYIWLLFSSLEKTNESVSLWHLMAFSNRNSFLAALVSVNMNLPAISFLVTNS